MKRVVSAALFSAVFCALSSTLLFVAEGAMVAHDFHPAGLANTFLMIGVFSIPLGGSFGFILGLFGGWIVPKFPFVSTRASFVTTAVFAGGFLGCIFPVTARYPIGVPWYAFALLGSVCGGVWARYWLRVGTHKQNARAISV
jgi:hypothetical protein